MYLLFFSFVFKPQCTPPLCASASSASTAGFSVIIDVLESNPSVMCFSDEDPNWRGLATLSFFYIILFSSFPFILLYDLWDNNSKLEADEVVQKRLGFLYLKYKRKFPYWDPAVDMPKKWLIVFFNTFMPTGESQAAMSIVIIVIFWAAHALAEPFRIDYDRVDSPNLENRLQHLSYACELFMVIFILIFAATEEDLAATIILSIIYFTVLIAMGYGFVIAWYRQNSNDCKEDPNASMSIWGCLIQSMTEGYGMS